MKQPINRLLMLKKPGLSGPLFQRVAARTHVASMGNFYGSGGTNAPANPTLGFTIWDDGETFWDVDTRTNEPATTWDRRR